MLRQQRGLGRGGHAVADDQLAGAATPRQHQQHAAGEQHNESNDGAGEDGGALRRQRASVAGRDGLDHEHNG